MSWFYLALTCAFTLALADAYTKKYFHDCSGVYILLVRLSLPGILLLPFSVYFGIPDVPNEFWYLLFILVLLEITAMWLYVLSIRDAPLHLTLPYMAFTPVFNIVTGYFALGEVISIQGGLGIILIVMGAYLLNLDQITKSGINLFAPLAAIFKLKGSRFMLIAAGIYSLTSVYSKRAMQYVPPEEFGALYFSIIGITLLLIVLLTQPVTLRHFAKRPKANLIVGSFMALMVFTHFMAISQVEVAYMIAVKRTSMIFGMLLGAWMFKDMILRQHLSAGLIMLAGVFLILI